MSQLVCVERVCLSFLLKKEREEGEEVEESQREEERRERKKQKEEEGSKIDKSLLACHGQRSARVNEMVH